MADREEYIDKLENQLREWNSQLDKLQEKAEKQSEEAQNKINKRMDQLKAKRSQLKLKLDQIKDSGEDAFSKIREDAEILWGDVKGGFSDIRKIIRE